VFRGVLKSLAFLEKILLLREKRVKNRKKQGKIYIEPLGT
jgi:hypothetical protein